MRWKRHEEMMRESYERQTIKASASTGQLPHLYGNVNAPPPGLSQHGAQQHASPVPLMSHTMAYMGQGPPQHFGQLEKGHEVLAGMTGIPIDASVTTGAEPSGGSTMPPILPLATIGKTKPRIMKTLEIQVGQMPMFLSQIRRKCLRARWQAVRSVGGKGSYSLNYQKQKIIGDSMCGLGAADSCDNLVDQIQTPKS